MVSHQIRDGVPKFQPFEGEFDLMDEWNESLSGTNPGSGHMGIADNANGRTVGPQSSMAVHCPGHRFASARAVRTTGPSARSHSQMRRELRFGCLSVVSRLSHAQSTRHVLQQFVPTRRCHRGGESPREPNREEIQNTYV
jgi:hypothetical protein